MMQTMMRDDDNTKLKALTERIKVRDAGNIKQVRNGYDCEKYFKKHETARYCIVQRN